MTSFSFASSIKALVKGARTVMVVAPAKSFGKRRFPRLLGKRDDTTLVELAAETAPGDLGAHASTLTGRAIPHLAVGVLPDTISRYNTPSRAESVRRVVASAAAGKGKLGIILVAGGEEELVAKINAVGRAFPKYSAKTGKKASRRVQIIAVDPDGKPLPIPAHAETVMQATRDAAEMVDTPPTELNPEEFATRAKAMLKGVKGVKIKEIVGDKLLAASLNGIHAVGRCAVKAPRMVVATYEPSAPSDRHIALVGKGVCYDTGGLNLKISGNMSGMKGDMGGAAAVLGAFRSLVAHECPFRLSLIICLAENAIGPAAYKPDDIITMHSGKTVEINNTDAEGRLLLGDGVSYAARELGADTIFNAATLTGAQLVALGVLHCAVMSNDDELENAAVTAGRQSGDLAHPLPFAPEFYQSEFSSAVADMCNSVRNRMNAQSACAAQFVYSHIANTKARWCHLDIAGPSFPKDRATGFGVALLTETITALAQS